MANLSIFYKPLYTLNFLVPKIILNFFYDLFGKHRYKIFGKYQMCVIPKENIKNKFIFD